MAICLWNGGGVEISDGESVCAEQSIKGEGRATTWHIGQWVLKKKKKTKKGKSSSEVEGRNTEEKG